MYTSTQCLSTVLRERKHAAGGKLAWVLQEEVWMTVGVSQDTTHHRCSINLGSKVNFCGPESSPSTPAVYTTYTYIYIQTAYEQYDLKCSLARPVMNIKISWEARIDFPISFIVVI